MTEHLTQDEKWEIYVAACDAFRASRQGDADVLTFRFVLARCGYNATAIDDIVREHRK